MQRLHRARDRRRVDVLHLHRLQRDHRLARSDALTDRDLHCDDAAVHRRAQLAVTRGTHVPCARLARGVDDLERGAAVAQPQTIAIAQPGGTLHHAVAHESHAVGGELEHVDLQALPAQHHFVAALAQVRQRGGLRAAVDLAAQCDGQCRRQQAAAGIVPRAR